MKKSAVEQSHDSATKVFKYGSQPLVKTGQFDEFEQQYVFDSLIREQMKLAREYYNNLVENENNRRRFVWGGDKPKWPHEPIISYDEETNRKKVEYCDCELCKKYFRDTVEKYKQTPRLDLKLLRAKAVEDGLYWGSYLLVEQYFNRAVSTTTCFSLVKFRSWKQGGYAGVQIQKSRPCESEFLIEQAPDNRTGKRAGNRHTLQIRVAKKNGSGETWSEPVAFEMHRPLQGTPTNVMVHYYYRGEREIWSVCFTCKDLPKREDNATEGRVAIDVGWRIMSDKRVRIAYARGDDGKEYEFALPPTWKELADRADRIRSARDTMLNIIAARHKRLSIFCNKKKCSARGARHYVMREGMNSDIELEGWRRWDKHMEDYELGCRNRSTNVRRDAMRVWLRKLRRLYTLAIIKDSSHKEMKDHEKAVKNGMAPRTRKSAHHAAPGEVIEEICQVFGRQTNVAVVEAPGTTMIWGCEECNYENSKEVGPELMLSCERCGHEEDRDHVSTQNLLTRYFMGEYKKPKARKTTARFAKRHKKNGQPHQCEDSRS
jgi:hypothetical protein